MGSGHGWSGANYVTWNCRGTLICQQPPTAQNFAIGFVGNKGRDAFPGRPSGWWESHSEPVVPESLFTAQHQARKKSAAESVAVNFHGANSACFLRRQRSSGFPTAGSDMRLPSHGALPEKKANQ